MPASPGPAALELPCSLVCFSSELGLILRTELQGQWKSNALSFLPFGVDALLTQEVSGGIW